MFVGSTGVKEVQVVVDDNDSGGALCDAAARMNDGQRGCCCSCSWVQ